MTLGWLATVALLLYYISLRPAQTVCKLLQKTQWHNSFLSCFLSFVLEWGSKICNITRAKVKTQSYLGALNVSMSWSLSCWCGCYSSKWNFIKPQSYTQIIYAGFKCIPHYLQLSLSVSDTGSNLQSAFAVQLRSITQLEYSDLQYLKTCYGRLLFSPYPFIICTLPNIIHHATEAYYYAYII